MSALERFLGGSVLGVAIRLIAVSVAVGVLMSWLNLTPWDMIDNFREALAHLYQRSSFILRGVFTYFMLGAVIVIPIWLIVRFMKSVPSRKG